MPIRSAVRRVLIGAFTGAIAGAAFYLVLGNLFAALLLGFVSGALYGLLFRQPGATIVDSAFTCAAFGVPMWALLNVIVFPILAGQPAQWNAQSMRALFPQLVAWVLFGFAFGVVLHALDALARRILGDEIQPVAAQAGIKTRIVILGGGFAGMTTAEYLEKEFGADPSVSITLVNETNSLLFTPMLAEVAASSLEPTHISAPLRTSLRRTNVLRAKVTSIDLDRRHVGLASPIPLPDARSGTGIAGDAAHTWNVPFDHLVLGLGAVSNYLGMKGVEENAFDFKSLGDAMRIRNHVINCFEWADREPDHVKRRRLLTFVVAGAGFAGSELAGGLNDFARGMVADYPGLTQDDVKIVVVHPRDRILPELSETLGRYALERMRDRGVTFMLNARMADATPNEAIMKLGDALERVPCHTLVWTAGTAPNPLLKTLPAGIEHDKRGAVLVTPTLAVPNAAGLWALGDCAVVPDVLSEGKTCPPTAQFALREAKTLAHNVHAAVHGRPLTPFKFKSIGLLCVVGHQTACAEIGVPFTNKTLLFSGLLAWLMWRAIYLAKLPGLQRKVRVLADWVIELFFPRDIVQTID